MAAQVNNAQELHAIALANAGFTCRYARIALTARKVDLLKPSHQ